jgi:hypothetical protein
VCTLFNRHLALNPSENPIRRYILGTMNSGNIAPRTHLNSVVAATAEAAINAS